MWNNSVVVQGVSRYRNFRKISESEYSNSYALNSAKDDEQELSGIVGRI